MITQNAKDLIDLVAKQVRLADHRCANEHIKPEQVQGCIIEGLIAESKRNINMKTFLTTMAYIPAEEDINEDVEWAEDRREARDHDVRTRLAVDGPRDRNPDHDDAAWPSPGERIC